MHSTFNNASNVDSESGTVQFELTENRIDDLTYYLKVTADGGEIYWSEEKSFAS